MTITSKPENQHTPEDRELAAIYSPANKELYLLSSILLVSGISFLICYALVVFIELTPIAIGQPIWSINAAVTLIDNAFYALVGLLFVAISGLLSPQYSFAYKFYRRLARLAMWVCLGFLLLVPLQAFATWKTQQTFLNSRTTQLEIARARLDRFRSHIAGARNTTEIQALLKAEQGISLSSEDLRRPVDVLQQGLLTRLDEARRQLSNTRGQRRAWQWVALQRTIRISLMSLVYAVAFAAMARRKESTQSLLSEFGNTLAKTNLGGGQAIENWLEHRRSRRAFRQEILRNQQLHQQRLWQDEQDHLMASDALESQGDQPGGQPIPGGSSPGTNQAQPASDQRRPRRSGIVDHDYFDQLSTDHQDPDQAGPTTPAQ